MPCLVNNCVECYKAGCLKKPISADSLAPWASVTFSVTAGSTGTQSGGNQSQYGWFSANSSLVQPTNIDQNAYTVSVGNKSAPFHHNTAVIKSFKYGSSTLGGAGCTVEIYDEEGTSFQAWIERLNRSLVNAATRDYKMRVQFGWTATNCNGSTTMIPACGSPWELVSPPLYFLPQNITSIYEGGKIKYTIQGLDMMQRVFESRAERVYGSTPARISLKQAIRQLFADNIPAINSVKFLRRETNAPPAEWGFSQRNGGFDGPLGVYTSDQQNALATARKWLTGFTTDRDKGIVASWNSTSPIPELIFWEDPFPGCSQSVNADTRSLGTYIVNGGNQSSVISFAPSVQWNFMYAGRAGGPGGPGSAQPAKMQGQCDIQATGTQTSISPYNWDIGLAPPEDQARNTAQASAAHERANMTYQPITAELKIQGDPSFVNPLTLVGGFVALVVINPFHLDNNLSGNCSQWIARPTCNPVFSNKAWMIKGVDHDIREGSYCTTLSLFLATPGSNIDIGQPLGGAGSGGYQLPPQ